MSSIVDYSAEQLEVLAVALIDDLERIRVHFALGDMPPRAKIEFLLPIWYIHKDQIAAARQGPSMASSI